MKQSHKTIALWAVIILLSVSLLHFLNTRPVLRKPISFSDFLTAVQRNQVEKVTIEKEEYEGKFKPGHQEGTYFETVGPAQSEKAFELLSRSDAVIEYKKPHDTPLWQQILISWLPMILLFGFFFFSMRQIQIGGGRAMSFGRSRARLLSENQKKATFKDVAGVEEAKFELEEIIQFLKDPKRFTKLGGRIPKGVLLIGAPGTGKTLLAKAVAGEAGVPFFSISGSDFVEMFVGVGASVTGDTPVLIRKGGQTRLVPIGEFIDGHYKSDDSERPVPISGVQTLGFEQAKTAFRGTPEGSQKKFFGGSNWKNVRAVYRHRVERIYEIRYLGGVLRTTGDHSLFVRERNMIVAKRADQLRPGDILVNLPFKVRGAFSEEVVSQKLPLWEEDPDALLEYQYALASAGFQSQAAVAEVVGVSQATIGNWQNGTHLPRALSQKSLKQALPDEVDLTLDLMKLFGYYTAEGRCNGSLEFVFGSHERRIHEDCIRSMQKIFGLLPSLEETPDHSLRIKYYSAPLGRFFAKHCGNGSHDKHLPESLWDLSKPYFLSYLEGYSLGDGYTSSEGKLIGSSVSQQLIRELAWLAGMHGIKVGVEATASPAGRIIKKKSLPESPYWRLTIGKSAHPFADYDSSPNQFKKPLVKRIEIKPYDGYVYDLCGCDNEAFFGGEKPILLHNSRVRDLFEQGKKHAPCIIFIDEIDAVGRHRGAGLGGGHDEREQTLNQLLVEMDGFESNEGVIIMAATNRPDVLDPALLRPGRFDRRVVVPRPDVKGREEILQVHSRRTVLGADVDLPVIARGTPGFSGADLENLVNEAALNAARYGKKFIEMTDFELAKDKVIMGAERKSMILSEEEKKQIAYHESGHTLVAKSVPGADPVHKVTIIPRGMALGLTQQLPIDERHLHSKEYAETTITVLMGGRCAEELIFNSQTTGAGDDIDKATELARKMVCEWGMSDLGPLTFGRKEGEVFLGRDFTQHQEYSDQTAVQIDEEVRKIATRNYNRAKAILKERIEILHRLAQTLLEFESLDGDQIDQVIRGEKLEPAPRSRPPGSPSKQSEERVPLINPIPEPGKA